MPATKSGSLVIIIVLMSLVWARAGAALEADVQTAEKLMRHQLEALKSKDLRQFVANGNAAFKSFTDEYTFEALVMQRHAKIARGYRLEYLGAIRSIGMLRHLWKVHINGDKYQLLGSLSLANGNVVGFSLE